MRLLLDTHVVLWAMRGDPRLSKSVRQMLEDREHQVFVSAISFWEMAIKHTRGLIRLDLDTLVDIAKAEGFEELPVRISHTLQLRALSNIRRDPFDRLLIAQSISENLRLMTADEEILAYEGVAGFHPLAV